MTPITFKELFGLSYVDTMSHWTFSTTELDRVNLDFYALEIPSILVAVHEMMKRAYIGNWVDSSGCVVGDNIGGILYDFASEYNDFKIVQLGKRFEGTSVIWSYFWYIPDLSTKLNQVTLDMEQELVAIVDSTVLLNKVTLGNPINTQQFAVAFLAYLSELDYLGVQTDGNGIVLIKTNYNISLDLDEVN